MENLAREDQDLFYSLFGALIDYTNAQKKIRPGMGTMKGAGRASLNPADVKAVADAVWDDLSLIDDFLDSEEGKDLLEEEREIVSSWKRRVKGRFLLERHLKNGSIFVGPENKVYQVCGIISSWREMMAYYKPPIMMQMTILPFKDVIISDGLVQVYPVHFGSGIRSDYKEIYMEAKENGEIIRTL